MIYNSTFTPIDLINRKLKATDEEEVVQAIHDKNYKDAEAIADKIVKIKPQTAAEIYFRIIKAQKYVCSKELEDKLDAICPFEKLNIPFCFSMKSEDSSPKSPMSLRVVQWSTEEKVKARIAHIRDHTPYHTDTVKSWLAQTENGFNFPEITKSEKVTIPGEMQESSFHKIGNFEIGVASYQKPVNEELTNIPEEIRKAVIAKLAQISKIDPSTIKPEMNLTFDLKLNSENMSGLVDFLNEQYHIPQISHC